MAATHIAVVMTVYNRRKQTLACLRALHASTVLKAGVAMSVCLTDDGSTDGTSEAVSTEFPDTRILRGNGALYWNGGMRKAMTDAMALRPDYYLWLNDDVRLVPDAIERMIQTAQAERRAGGASPSWWFRRRSDNGKTSYGGRVRLHRFRPLRFSLGRARFRSLALRDDERKLCLAARGCRIAHMEISMRHLCTAWATGTMV